MTARIAALRLVVAAVAGGLPAVPAAACPPQVTVEHPAASAADSSFVLVHASPGCQRGLLTVTGTAEGLVGGQRRSIRLDVVPTDAEGVYRVRRQWPSRGVWVLRFVASVGADHAVALVGVSAAGEIVTVRQQDPARRIYPVITDADVERMLRSLAAG